MLEIAVCDDNVDDLDKAVKILHKIFSSQNIGYNIRAFSSANEMSENISEIDIGVLDISMEEINGLKLGRKIKEKFPNVKLIYITNYEEYCMQAINDAHAFSFLCKPLNNQEMEKQIMEVLSHMPDTALEKEFYKVTNSKGKKYISIKLKLYDILYLSLSHI